MLPPVHTEKSGPALIAGKGFTVTVTVDVLIQPAADVPVTVYVVVAAGLNATPCVTPLFQEYVDAPVAVKVTVPPKQTDCAKPALTIGKGFTVTVTADVLIQPAADVPVTVYVVVAAGVNATPCVTPLFHV